MKSLFKMFAAALPFVCALAAAPASGDDSCWVDYEFDGYSYASSGSDATELKRSGSDVQTVIGGTAQDNFLDDASLLVAAKPVRDITYPTAWTAVIYATVPRYEDRALITFGTKDGGLLGFVAGDTSKDEVRLVLTTGNAQYTTLKTMTVENAYTSPHLYILYKARRRIEVYVDGALVYGENVTNVTVGNGFQVGTVHGGNGATGIVPFTASANPDDPMYYQGDLVRNAYIGALRIYNSQLSEEARAALAAEFLSDRPGERTPYALEWTQPGEAVWDETTVWRVAGTQTEATFEPDDSVVFGDVSGAASAKVAAPAASLAGLYFGASTTAYEITGGALSATGVVDTAAAPVTVFARIDVAGDASLSVAGANAAPQRFLDVRGSLGSLALSAPDVTLGTGGALDIPRAASVAAATKLTIDGGDGTVSYAAGNGFAGALQVSQGTFVVDCTFNKVRATEGSPIVVNGTGRLFFKAGADARDRLPNGAFVVVDGPLATLEVQGINPFPRDTRVGPTVIVRDGGTFRTNGVQSNYDVHVWSLRLESGRLYFSGTAANYSNRGLKIDGGTLYSSGRSFLEQEDGCPNRLVATSFEVEDGTLFCNVQTDGSLVKTGAGALVFGGANGGPYTGTLDVRAGTLVANERSAALKSLKFADGTTFDLSGVAGEVDFTEKTFGATGRVTVATGGRALKQGDRLVAWSAAPAGSFVLSSTLRTAELVKKDDGLYVNVGVMISIE